ISMSGLRGQRCPCACRGGACADLGVADAQRSHGTEGRVAVEYDCNDVRTSAQVPDQTHARASSTWGFGYDPPHMQGTAYYIRVLDVAEGAQCRGERGARQHAEGHVWEIQAAF